MVQLLAITSVVLILQVLSLGISTPVIHYVRTTEASPNSCPGQPCLTLHQYTLRDNFTSGTTFHFLPGNHSLQQSMLSLRNADNLTLRGEGSAIITCTNLVNIYCECVTGFYVEGLTFLLNHIALGVNASAFIIISCSEVQITDTSFQGSEDTPMRALLLEESSVTVHACIFEENNVVGLDNDGGAILLEGTNLTMCGSYFAYNRAHAGGGGAVSGYKSNILLDGSIPNFFASNFAGREGGAVHCFSRCTLEMRGQNSFQDNYSSRGCRLDCNGGALSFRSSRRLTLAGNVDFLYNEAYRGGAIWPRLSSVGM